MHSGKTLQSNDGVLHTPTFRRDASDENVGEAEVCETHSEGNVVPNNFNGDAKAVAAARSHIYTSGGGVYVGNIGAQTDIYIST